MSVSFPDAKIFRCGIEYEAAFVLVAAELLCEADSPVGKPAV
jgi:hypothetical protein